MYDDLDGLTTANAVELFTFSCGHRKAFRT
jgi:hypothetical protein